MGLKGVSTKNSKTSYYYVNLKGRTYLVKGKGRMSLKDLSKCFRNKIIAVDRELFSNYEQVGPKSPDTENSKISSTSSLEFQQLI